MLRLLPGPALHVLRAFASVRATGLSSALMAASTQLPCESDGPPLVKAANAAIVWGWYVSCNGCTSTRMLAPV